MAAPCSRDCIDSQSWLQTNQSSWQCWARAINYLRGTQTGEEAYLPTTSHRGLQTVHGIKGSLMQANPLLGGSCVVLAGNFRKNSNKAISLAIPRMNRAVVPNEHAKLAGTPVGTKSLACQGDRKRLVLAAGLSKFKASSGASDKCPHREDRRECHTKARRSFGTYHDVEVHHGGITQSHLFGPVTSIGICTLTIPNGKNVC